MREPGGGDGTGDTNPTLSGAQIARSAPSTEENPNAFLLSLDFTRKNFRQRKFKLVAYLYVCPVISFLTMTQSTSHLASSPELSWPIWTVVSFPKFWHCNE